MLELIWIVPFGVFMLYALWRFIRGIGPREVTEQQEQATLDLALGKPPQDPLWTGRVPDDPLPPSDPNPR